MAEKLQFKCINKKYTIKAVENLENKNSSSHDGISNKLLKSIKCSISKSLTIIINQMITTGIFPDAVKVSKVTPIFKKGDCSLMSMLCSITHNLNTLKYILVYHRDPS